MSPVGFSTVMEDYWGRIFTAHIPFLLSVQQNRNAVNVEFSVTILVTVNRWLTSLMLNSTLIVLTD